MVQRIIPEFLAFLLGSGTESRFNASMKLIRLTACFLVFCLSSLQGSPLDPKGDAKITKNEAEHIALKRFPGARVTSAKLETVQGKLVWSLQIAEEGAKTARQVAVNAVTGRIAPPAEEKP